MFVIVNKNPSRCLSLEKYLPSTSKNSIIQDVEDGMDIEYQVNPMEEYDTNNIGETDDGTNRLIHDIFSPID